MSRRLAGALVGLFLSLTPLAAAERDAPLYLVVTAPAFRESVEPLCERRRAEGMRVVVIQTTDLLTPKQIHAGDADALRGRVHKLCGEAAGPYYVLLVGATEAVNEEGAAKIVVPPLRGTRLRMKDRPTDLPYACFKKELEPLAAVGRFPVRSEVEARLAVKRTLDFEKETALWRNRLTLLVGSPGGVSALERDLAEGFLLSIAQRRLEKVHPMWTGRAVMDLARSPFAVPPESLTDVSRRYLEEGQLFSVYLGHSGADGLWSPPHTFLSRDHFTKLKMPGVFFTCGCFACQPDGRGAGGYGRAAFRNPDGPVAVMGAQGESFGAFGQLAIDGLLDCLGRSEPPERLADYWRAVQGGITSGKMAPLVFRLFDEADGTRGRVPLEAQRPEHLEMWTLLGDPALRLPLRLPRIVLDAPEEAAPGARIVIRGKLPEGWSKATVFVTLERPLGGTPTGLDNVPAEADKAKKVRMANHERANAVVVASVDVAGRSGAFRATLKLPDEAPWPRLVVRAQIENGTRSAYGVTTLAVKSGR